MITINELLLLILIVCFIVLAYYVSQLKSRLMVLQHKLTQRTEQASNLKASSLPADLLDLRGPIITVEINNPLEVAGKEVPIADFASAFVPVVVRKKVYQEVRKELARELSARGIAAKVNLVFKEGD